MKKVLIQLADKKFASISVDAKDKIEAKGLLIDGEFIKFRVVPEGEIANHFEDVTKHLVDLGPLYWCFFDKATSKTYKFCNSEYNLHTKDAVAQFLKGKRLSSNLCADLDAVVLGDVNEEANCIEEVDLVRGNEYSIVDWLSRVHIETPHGFSVQFNFLDYLILHMVPDVDVFCSDHQVYRVIDVRPKSSLGEEAERRFKALELVSQVHFVGHYILDHFERIQTLWTSVKDQPFRFDTEGDRGFFADMIGVAAGSSWNGLGELRRLKFRCLEAIKKDLGEPNGQEETTDHELVDKHFGPAVGNPLQTLVYALKLASYKKPKNRRCDFDTVVSAYFRGKHVPCSIYEVIQHTLEKTRYDQGYDLDRWLDRDYDQGDWLSD